MVRAVLFFGPCLDNSISQDRSELRTRPRPGTYPDFACRSAGEHVRSGTQNLPCSSRAQKLIDYSSFE
jgi:hypothetical protein